MKMVEKKIFITGLIAGLAIGSLAAKWIMEKTPGLRGDGDRQSYALGQQIGKNLKNQKIDFNPNILAYSLRDAAHDKTPLLTQVEMQQAMEMLHQSLAKKQNPATSSAAANPSQAFMENNKNQPGVITTTSGLQYILEKEGSGKRPLPSDVVKINYKVTSVTGQLLENTFEKKKPLEIPLRNLPQGMVEALMLIKTGGKIKAFIPSVLMMNSPLHFQTSSDSVLIFEMELLSVKSQARK